VAILLSVPDDPLVAPAKLGVSADLTEALERGLAVLPDQRIQSVRELQLGTEEVVPPARSRDASRKRTPGRFRHRPTANPKPVWESGFEHLRTGRRLCRLEGHRDWVRGIASSPDSHLLATA
jgi:hypothetical protein